MWVRAFSCVYLSVCEFRISFVWFCILRYVQSVTNIWIWVSHVHAHIYLHTHTHTFFYHRLKLLWTTDQTMCLWIWVSHVHAHIYLHIYTHTFFYHRLKPLWTTDQTMCLWIWVSHVHAHIYLHTHTHIRSFTTDWSYYGPRIRQCVSGSAVSTAHGHAAWLYTHCRFARICISALDIRCHFLWRPKFT